ncbi:MAG: hypothetical protein KAT77_04410 [Nanoarchaeota archaeon]|nr:hypothetical protein [Nanoarchaeota archaeon]
MNKDYVVKQLFGEYSRMSTNTLINIREDMAIGPDKFYKLGQDPMREKRLGVLTDILMERMKTE